MGGWNLAFLCGALLAGGVIGWLVPSPTIAISDQTVRDLAALGVSDVSGYVPASLFSWPALATARGLALIVGGGFLVGFGTAYAGGCTSGHGITGLAALQLPSLVAVLDFSPAGWPARTCCCRCCWDDAICATCSMGGAFGLVLMKSEAISWFRIQEMFRFQSFTCSGFSAARWSPPA